MARGDRQVLWSVHVIHTVLTEICQGLRLGCTKSPRLRHAHHTSKRKMLVQRSTAFTNLLVFAEDDLCTFQTNPSAMYPHGPSIKEMSKQSPVLADNGLVRAGHVVETTILQQHRTAWHYSTVFKLPGSTEAKIARHCHAPREGIPSGNPDCNRFVASSTSQSALARHLRAISSLTAGVPHRNS